MLIKYLWNYMLRSKVRFLVLTLFQLAYAVTVSFSAVVRTKSWVSSLWKN